MAAVLLTADLFRNQFGPVCVTDFGPRAGFASGRLPTLFLRNAKVGAACGVSPDCRNQPAKRAGRVLRNRIDLGAVDDWLRDSAHGESSLHVALYQLNAYDVHIEDTRRTACGGSFAFMLRSRVLAPTWPRWPRRRQHQGPEKITLSRAMRR